MLYFLKHRTLFFLTCCATLCLVGCEGYRHVRGVVLDQQTKVPLDSVRCETFNPHIMALGSFDSNDPQYSDPHGAFDVTGEFGGCVPECPDILVRFSKKGYKTLQLVNPTDTIFYLTRADK
ncbi:hypothetical protein [Hymenobacter qilianensis]|uniref:hypothetical protein n=1 Tax=Hymenobacter qilianensis TaxID=1385715 RepID=UPI001E4470B8|nr:hypothetical protein [Hymenobacter qilianensis]